MGVGKLNLEVVRMLRSVLTAPLSSQKFSLVLFTAGSTGVFKKASPKCPCDEVWDARDGQGCGEAVPGQHVGWVGAGEDKTEEALAFRSCHRCRARSSQG